MSTNTLFIAKVIPLNTYLDAIHELSPMLAYCVLFDPLPKPILITHGLTSATLYILSPIAVAAEMSNHTELCVGMYIVDHNQMNLKHTICIHDSYDTTHIFHATIDALFSQHTQAGTFIDLLCYKKVKCALIKESKAAGFMQRRPPYRLPSSLLHDWDIQIPDTCNCFHISCVDCLRRRWRLTSSFKKKDSSTPPPWKHNDKDTWSSLPVTAVYNCAHNPFDWSVGNDVCVNSIW